MRTLICICAVCALPASGLSGDLTLQQADALIEEFRGETSEWPFALPRDQSWIILKDTLRPGLSIGLAGESCIYSNRMVTARTLHDPDPGALVYVTALLTSDEVRQVWTIATNLVSTIESDHLMGWSGPMYGLHIMPDWASVSYGNRNRDWMKVSRQCSILDPGELAEAAAILRKAVSNAFTRTSESNLGKIYYGRAEQDESTVPSKAAPSASSDVR